MSGPRVALAVLSKDLLLDVRSGDRIGHMAVFAALVVALLSIAGPSVTPATREWLPPLVWIVFLFTALLGLARSFQSEVERGAVVLLAQAPCDRGWVFLGKAGANLVTLFGVQLLTAALFVVFFDMPWGRAPAALLGIAVLGALGLSVVGTLLAAMAVAARFREFLLPVLLFPLILPVLVIASNATAEALAGEVSGRRWGMLALYDWAFLALGYFLFDHLLED